MTRAMRGLMVGVAMVLASPAVAQDTSAKPRQKKATSAKKNRGLGHPSIRLGEVHVDIRGLLQTSVHDSDVASDRTGDSGTDVAHKRIGLHGAVGKTLSFQVEGELGLPGAWRDVYVDYRPLDVLRVKAGHFKLPFSLDQNTSAADLNFTFRSESASDLAPGRQIGIMAHGRTWKRVLEYEGGVFLSPLADPHAPDDRVIHHRTTAGRLILHPFGRSRSSLGDLFLAAAFTAGTMSEGVSDLHGRTALGARFFPHTYWVNGSRRRTGFEAQWQPGPVSVAWEYMRVTDQRLAQGIGGEALSPFTAAGSYLSGTWAITGESKSRGIDRPRHPLFRGGVGAIEVAARIERVRFGEGIRNPGALLNPRGERPAGNADRIVTGGLNWYVNSWVKVQANMIRERLDDSSLGPVPAQAWFWSRVLQLQLRM